LVQKCELTNNAQQIYKELLDDMTISNTGTVATFELLKEITNTQLHSAKWNGKEPLFITRAGMSNLANGRAYKLHFSANPEPRGIN
jgi:hypothetical protein